MSDATDFANMMKLPPAEAVAYMVARGRIEKTFNWQDLWAEEHTRSFTVSRLAHADLLQTFRDKITASVKGDLSRCDFMRDMKSELQKAGWWGENQVLDPQTGKMLSTTFDASRLKLIYDTNIRTAQAAGRWQRFESTRASHPYLRYVTKRDERVRVSHRVFDNVTLPIDDPFWHSHTPPLGYRCRCRLVAMSKGDFEAGQAPDGSPLKPAAPNLGTQEFINKRTGEVTRVPVGITPGFGYNPGAAFLANQLKMTADKLAGLSPPLGRAALEAINSGADAQQAFSAWRANPQGNWPLAFLALDDLSLIQGKNPVASLSPETIAKQDRKHVEMTDAEYLQAQSVIDQAQIKAQEQNSLIYVQIKDTPDLGGYVLVVKATQTGKGLFVTSYRRLSRKEAARDREIARLLNKQKK